MFTLKSALLAIADKPEFSAKNKGDYTVIDYNLTCSDTFTGVDDEQTMILHNLRGTAFDNETGEIIRLGYHKFKNIGEEPSKDSLLNFSDSHIITRKLDGSCLFPIKTKDGFVWGTRAGVTDTSKLVDKFLEDHPLKEDYSNFVNSCLDVEHTPIFEYMSPENRVVIAYSERELVLTGMRCMKTGEYILHGNLKYIAEFCRIPIVHAYESIKPEDYSNFVKSVSDLHNDEGVVIRFESGNMNHHMVKLKSEEYVKLHKAVDQLKWTHDVIQLIVSGLIDDVYPILDISRRTKMMEYADGLLKAVQDTTSRIIQKHVEYSHIPSGKEFALAIQDEPFKSFLFKMKTKDISVQDMVIDFCKRKSTTQAGAIEVLEFLKFSGSYQ